MVKKNDEYAERHMKDYKGEPPKGLYLFLWCAQQGQRYWCMNYTRLQLLAE
jgi:hypothetical protein